MAVDDPGRRPMRVPGPTSPSAAGSTGWAASSARRSATRASGSSSSAGLLGVMIAAGGMTMVDDVRHARGAARAGGDVARHAADAARPVREPGQRRHARRVHLVALRRLLRAPRRALVHPRAVVHARRRGAAGQPRLHRRDARLEAIDRAREGGRPRRGDGARHGRSWRWPPGRPALVGIDAARATRSPPAAAISFAVGLGDPGPRRRVDRLRAGAVLRARRRRRARRRLDARRLRRVQLPDGRARLRHARAARPGSPGPPTTCPSPGASDWAGIALAAVVGGGPAGDRHRGVRPARRRGDDRGPDAPGSRAPCSGSTGPLGRSFGDLLPTALAWGIGPRRLRRRSWRPPRGRCSTRSTPSPGHGRDLPRPHPGDRHHDRRRVPPARLRRPGLRAHRARRGDVHRGAGRPTRPSGRLELQLATPLTRVRWAVASTVAVWLAIALVTVLLGRVGRPRRRLASGRIR